MRLDTATIYQIFWLAHSGRNKAEIARELGISRNSVNWHLTGRLIPSYPQRLRDRISPFRLPKTAIRQPPPGWISLAEASWLFPCRPTARTIAAHYPLRTEIVAGAAFTRLPWARACSRARFPRPPRGIFVTAGAARYLWGISIPGRLLSLASRPDLVPPAAVVHASLGIMAWSRMPFVTVTELDVMALTSHQG